MSVYQAWKYDNRGLYGSHPEDGAPDFRDVVTIGMLLERARAGQRIRVLEGKTRKDITHQILTVLWVKCEEQRPQFSQMLLREVIRLSGARSGRQKLAAAFFRFMADVYAEGCEEPQRISSSARRASLVNLLHIMESMPSETRSVFTLRKVYQLRHAEIAIRMGISETRVKECLIDAVAHLDRQLSFDENRGYGPDGIPGSLETILIAITGSLS